MEQARAELSAAIKLYRAMEMTFYLILVGLNTGEVVVRSIRTDDLHTDYVPIGHSTSLAARMQGLASGGALVVSAPTYQLTEGYFAFRPLGAAQVKGVSEPVQIYEVQGVGQLRIRLEVAARRGLVRFVGRQSQLAHMKRTLESAKVGHGQIVAAVGEAGLYRLKGELLLASSAERHAEAEIESRLRHRVERVRSAGHAHHSPEGHTAQAECQPGGVLHDGV